jgi:thioredoxin-like negative regulator of GroEL
VSTPATWKTLQAQAGKALSAGDVARAAHLLVEAIEQAPKEVRLYEQLVRVALLGGATDTAVQAALELRRLDPNHAPYGHLQAMALLAHGDATAAESVLEQVLVLSPGHADASLALAQLARSQGEPARAVVLLEGPAKAAPGEATLNVELGLALLEVGRAGDARAVLEAVVARLPDAHAARLALARALKQLGEVTLAQQHARRAKDTDDGEVREQAVRLVQELGGS